MRRTSIMTLGLVLIFIGIQLNLVDTYVLTPRFSNLLADYATVEREVVAAEAPAEVPSSPYYQASYSNNNQAATNATNQAVTVTGSIANTSLTTAQLASHTHTITGSKLGATGFSGPGGQYVFVTGSSNVSQLQSASAANAGSGTAHNHSHTLTGTLTGNITTSLTGAVTAAGTNSFSPFVVVNYIIKH